MDIRDVRVVRDGNDVRSVRDLMHIRDLMRIRDIRPCTALTGYKCYYMAYEEIRTIVFLYGFLTSLGQ